MVFQVKHSPLGINYRYELGIIQESSCLNENYSVFKIIWSQQNHSSNFTENCEIVVSCFSLSYCKNKYLFIRLVINLTQLNFFADGNKPV